MPAPPRHADRLLQLAQQKGLLRPNDLATLGIPRVYLTRLTASGKLTKAGRGLYRIADSSLSENESLTIVAARAPQAVFCLLTALQFHGLAECIEQSATRKRLMFWTGSVASVHASSRKK